MENWEINRGPHSKGLIRSMVDLISEEYMEYKRVWPLNRTSYSGDSRRYQFYALAGPVNTAATQILKIELHNYGHNIPRRFTQAHKATTKLTHLWSICLGFFLSPTSPVGMTTVSLANLHLRPDWHSPVSMWRNTGSDEPVTDKHMKTIEMAPPSGSFLFQYFSKKYTYLDSVIKNIFSTSTTSKIYGWFSLHHFPTPQYFFNL